MLMYCLLGGQVSHMRSGGFLPKVRMFACLSDDRILSVYRGRVGDLTQDKWGYFSMLMYCLLGGQGSQMRSGGFLPKVHTFACVRIG